MSKSHRWIEVEVEGVVLSPGSTLVRCKHCTQFAVKYAKGSMGAYDMKNKTIKPYYALIDCTVARERFIAQVDRVKSVRSDEPGVKKVMEESPDRKTPIYHREPPPTLDEVFEATATGIPIQEARRQPLPHTRTHQAVPPLGAEFRPATIEEARQMELITLIRLMYEDMVTFNIPTTSRRMAGELLYSKGMGELVNHLNNKRQ